MDEVCRCPRCGSVMVLVKDEIVIRGGSPAAKHKEDDRKEAKLDGSFYHCKRCDHKEPADSEALFEANKKVLGWNLHDGRKGKSKLGGKPNK